VFVIDASDLQVLAAALEPEPADSSAKGFVTRERSRMNTAQVAVLATVGAALLAAGITIFYKWREKRERQSKERGLLTTDPRVTRMPGPRRSYKFTVTNAGKSMMNDLRPELGEMVGQEWRTYSEPLAAKYLDDLKPLQELVFVITVKKQFEDRNPLTLRYTWVDITADRPSQTHLSGVEVPGA
jgi:hypothetical protein